MTTNAMPTLRLRALRTDAPLVKGRIYAGRRRWTGDRYIEIEDPKCLAHEACFAPLDEERKETWR